jgi:hypothetical protein
MFPRYLDNLMVMLLTRANLPYRNLPYRRLLGRRLGVRFVCYQIVIKSLSFCYLFDLTPQGVGCYVLVVSL